MSLATLSILDATTRFTKEPDDTKQPAFQQSADDYDDECIAQLTTQDFDLSQLPGDLFSTYATLLWNEVGRPITIQSTRNGATITIKAKLAIYNAKTLITFHRRLTSHDRAEFPDVVPV